MKAHRNYSKPILIPDAMIFSEIFNHLTEDLSIFDFIQLSQLLTIANKNFADPAKLNAIIISLF